VAERCFLRDGCGYWPLASLPLRPGGCQPGERRIPAGREGPAARSPRPIGEAGRVCGLKRATPAGQAGLLREPAIGCCRSYPTRPTLAITTMQAKRRVWTGSGPATQVRDRRDDWRPWRARLTPGLSNGSTPARYAESGRGSDPLLQLDRAAGLLDLRLELVGLLAVDPLLDRLRRLVDERLGLLQAEARRGADHLDHLDLLVARAG
jgi:hypothetical protein